MQLHYYNKFELHWLKPEIIRIYFCSAGNRTPAIKIAMVSLLKTTCDLCTSVYVRVYTMK